MKEQTGAASRRFSFDAATVWILAATVFIAILIRIPGGDLFFSETKFAVVGIGALIALISYVIARMVRGSIIVPPLPLLGVLWLIPVAYLLSTLFSGAELMSSVFGTWFESESFGFILVLALLTTLAALSTRRTRDFKIIFGVIGLAAFGTLLAQLVYIIAGRFVPGITPTTNLVGSFADLGQLACVSIGLGLIALRFVSFSMRAKLALYIGIVVGLVTLMFVNSPLCWVLVALVALGLFIEILLRRRNGGDDSEFEGVATLSEDAPEEHPTTGRLLAPPLITLLISVFFLVGGSAIGNEVATSLGIQAIDVRPSWQSTFSVGSHTYASSPLFGSGPGTFSEEWLKFRDRALNESPFWSVDFPFGIGYIPTAFVTTGIVGVIAWIAFLALFIFSGIRALLFRFPEDAYMRFVAVASFAGAALVLALALFSVPGPVMLAIGFVLLGLFISSLRYGKDRLEWGVIFSRSPRAGFAIVFSLTVLLLASVGAGYLVLERYLASAFAADAAKALAAGELEQAEQGIKNSLTLTTSDESYRLAASIGMERMRRVANNTSLTPTELAEQFQTALSGAVGAGLEATKMGPEDYQNWAILGTVYQSVASVGVEGAYEGAKGAFERAASLNPSSPLLPYVLAQLEITQKNHDAAEALLLSSVNLKRDYIPAILLLAQLEIQTGKAREALQAAEAAAYFAPNDPAVLLQVGLLRSGIGETEGAIEALTKALEINPQYANARFFLAAIYANQGRYADALTELRVVASMSPENAAAVRDDIASLEAEVNPFPTSRLRSLGMPQPPVAEPEPTAETAEGDAE